eukprot:2706684-Pleurochrysis_carterae.AAC.1
MSARMLELTSSDAESTDAVRRLSMIIAPTVPAKAQVECVRASEHAHSHASSCVQGVPVRVRVLCAYAGTRSNARATA